MDVHVLAPLDADHARQVARLSRLAADAAGLPSSAVDAARHLTVLAAAADDVGAVHAALEGIAKRSAPIHVRAHGYGLFCGGQPAATSVFVPVVRTLGLSVLQHHLLGAVRSGGGTVAAWTDEEHWTPHITILRHGLDAAALARATGVFAHHHRHPSWKFLIDRLVVTGPRGATVVAERQLMLEG